MIGQVWCGINCNLGREGSAVKRIVLNDKTVKFIRSEQELRPLRWK